MTARGTVLIVDDEREMRLLLEDELLDAGYEVVSAVSAGEALNRAATGAVDVVVTDLIMPGMKGDELLRELHTRQPDVPVVIMTAFGSIESAVEATKAGAYHYVAKPFRMEQLLVTVENALRERRLRRELLELRTSLGNGRHSMIAEGPSMRRAIDMVLRAAHVDTPVLLLGESGTGKELLARALHAEGPRRARRFVAVNCSSIPETLLESQLFGHWRGAFTDSREDRAGLFREADGGTILLDEVGDMTPALQGKLLRILQEREIHPLGRLRRRAHRRRHASEPRGAV
jgi:DNA-binding NtrC family response regulator